jgi:hypothetical protein
MTGAIRAIRARVAAAASRRRTRAGASRARGGARQDPAKPPGLSGIRVTTTILLLSLGLILCRASAQQQPAATQSARFTNVDVFLDPHGQPLAAYQVEVIADPARVTLVGIEGGSHPAFKHPPYYDPKALSGHRVILAALNTGSDLPRVKTRVARLHLRVIGTEPPIFSSKLIVAASASDQSIEANVTVSEGASP